MYQRQTKEYTIWNSVTPKTITSSTDATPIVITATSHGFATGDLVLIYGHTTNVAANGIFSVVKVDANSFQLKHRYTGASIAGSGAGAGASGIAVVAPKILLVSDFRHAVLSIQTASSATTTIKVAGSIGQLVADDTAGHGDTPNFGATTSDTNPYQFVQLVDLDTAATLNGATGIVVAGTDINKQYEVNINVLKYLTLIPVTWTQGAITAKILLATEQ